MSIRNIIIEPDPILRKKSTTLETVDDSTRKLLDDMLQTMYNAPGIGLAAVQIGILKRIIVIDVSKKEEEKKPLFLINPEITYQSEETSIYEEGCLSLPDHFAEIERPAKCKINYIDYHGKKAELEAEGLLSTCVQHEIDHLDGVLFVDHISSLKRNMILRKLTKIKKQEATV